MMQGLWYLLWHTLANRFRLGLRRLKKPQYLIGTLFGVAYFGFFVLGPGSGRHANGGEDAGWGRPVLAGADLALLEGAFAAGFLGLLFLGWLLPRQRAVLPLSEGEVAFLFPAPVNRQTLIRFHLLRAQLGLLFTAVIMLLVWRRRAGGWEGALLGLAGWWLFMLLLEIHRQTAAFARTWLADRGCGPWRRRGVLLGLLGIFLVAEALWLRPHLPAFTPEFFRDQAGWRSLAELVLDGGPLGGLLEPARWLIRPLVAVEPMARLGGVAAQAVTCALLYAVLMRLDVPFEEETLMRSQQRSQAIAMVRSGNWHLAGRPAKARRPWFRLRPTGTAWVALCWKNLIAVRGLLGNKVWWIMLVCLLAPLSLPLLTRGASIAAGVAMMLLGMSPMLLFMGPHVLRCDLRQDLSSLDVLKPLPLRGWQLILGEVTAPVVVLSVVQWGVLVTIALLAGVAGTGEGGLPPWEVVTGGLGLLTAVAILLPAFNFVSVLLLNGFAVLFPAWQGSLTGFGARGFGAMGAHLLLMLGHFLGLFLLLLVPAGLGTVTAFLLAGSGLPWPWAVLPASLLATLLLAAEAAGVVLMLGDRFEQLDLSDEPEL